MNSVDVGLFRVLNGAHTPLLDAFFGIVSGLADGLVVAMLCTLLMVFRLHLGAAALVAFALSGVAVQALKHLFATPRPPAVLENVHVLGERLTTHSFPSGHAASAGVMVVLAFLLWGVRDWRAWTTACLFLLAAYGRIYGGVHFPLDVMVGLLLGMVIMLLCWRWSRRWPVAGWESSPWAWKLPGLALIIEADVLAMGYHLQPSTAQPLALVLPLTMVLIFAGVWIRRHGR